MPEPIRWGVIGPGFIATHFARDLQYIPDDAVVTAVASSRAGGADAFAAEFDVPNVHPSYADLVADPEVDAVYVATPHSGHHAAALLAIDAGKHVLVEKPVTINERQAAELVGAARTKGVFFMEAMWTRFLPHIAYVHDVISSGRLGEIRYLFAEQGLWFDPADADHRLFDPDLGGGALLDLGIYPISLALSILGAPRNIVSAADLTDRGVDAQTTSILQYGNGTQAICTSTLLATTRTGAVIAGTRGRIEIEPRWMTPSEVRVIDEDGTVTVRENDYVGHGLREEAVEVARCIRSGLIESPLMPHDFTLLTMATMDAIRGQVGLRYSVDDAGVATRP